MDDEKFYSLKLALVVIFLFLQPGNSRSEDSLFTPEIANSSLAKRVFTLIEKNKDNMLTEWIALTEIPAPSGREEKRAH